MIGSGPVEGQEPDVCDSRSWTIGGPTRSMPRCPGTLKTNNVFITVVEGTSGKGSSSSQSRRGAQEPFIIRTPIPLFIDRPSPSLHSPSPVMTQPQPLDAAKPPSG